MQPSVDKVDIFVEEALVRTAPTVKYHTILGAASVYRTGMNCH